MAKAVQTNDAQSGMNTGMYRASGTDNLRANPGTKYGGGPASPAAKGKDAGGTSNLGAADVTVRRAAPRAQPAGTATKRGNGVTSFAGDRT